MLKKQRDEALDQSAGSPLPDNMSSAHMGAAAEVRVHLQTVVYNQIIICI
jgi:hypothetical protein